MRGGRVRIGLIGVRMETELCVCVLKSGREETVRFSLICQQGFSISRFIGRWGVDTGELVRNFVSCIFVVIYSYSYLLILQWKGLLCERKLRTEGNLRLVGGTYTFVSKNLHAESKKPR